jgi:hypothetical protein
MRSMNLSVKVTRCYRAHPLATRLLAAGLLPFPQLRFSTCQGVDRLIQISSELYRLWCKSTIANLRQTPKPLHGAVHLSQHFTEINPDGTKRSKKSLNGAFYVHTGAEDTQPAFPIAFAGADCPSPVERETALPALIACAGRKAGFSFICGSR